jgi:exosortase
MLSDIDTAAWRKAVLGLRRTDLVRAGLIASILAMIYVLFHLQGNTTDVRAFGRSAFSWMVTRWSDAFFVGADYSHGWLIPMAAAWLIWRRRHDLAAAPKSIARAGLAVVVFGLLCHWLGAKAQQTRLSLFGLGLIIWGIPYYLCGKDVAKILLFPCAYLMLCIPLNFLDSLTFPLRLFATAISVGLLNGLGLPIQRNGTAIFSSDGDFSLDVADPCSGIRSLMALTAITAVYGYVTQPTPARKWILFLSSVPLAMIGNIARIVIITLGREAFGPEAAEKMHEYSGYLVFAVAVLCMIALGNLMKMNFSEVIARWKRDLLSPTPSLQD